MKSHCKKAFLSGLAILLTLLAADSAFGQTAVEPAAPLWKVDPLGQGVPFTTHCASNEDNNGPLLIGNPLLDSGAGMPGLVASIELGIVLPHVENRLTDTVTRTSGATDTLALPSAGFGVNVTPKVEFAYRWGQATGELIFGWRSLRHNATQPFGPADSGPFAPTGAALSSRLNLQVFDLDYGSHEPLTVFGVDMKWRVGLRGFVYYADSEAANDSVFQHVTDHYWGLGPHAMVDFRRSIQDTGFDLFGRFDFSLPFGRLNQHYTETVTTAGMTDSGASQEHDNVQTMTLGFQAGLTWTSPWNPKFHITGGYIYDLYQAVGTITAQPSPTETFWYQGGFLRAEWNY